MLVSTCNMDINVKNTADAPIVGTTIVPTWHETPENSFLELLDRDFEKNIKYIQKI